MYSVSAEFKAIANRQTIPPYQVRTVVNGRETQVLEVQFKDTRDSLMGSFSAKTVTLLFDANAYDGQFKGATIEIYFSFKELNEEIPIGIFYVDDDDITFDEVKKTYKVVAYDGAILFDKPIDDLSFECDEGWEVLDRIADKVGVSNNGASPDSISALGLYEANLNASDIITYRQAVKAICQIGIASAHINRDGSLRYSDLSLENSPSSPVVDARDYFELKIDKESTPINSVLYEHSSFDDPIVINNESSIALHGINQIKFKDSFLIENLSREQAETLISSASSPISHPDSNLKVHPFSINNGIIPPWLDAGDAIFIQDTNNVAYPSRVQNIEWTWNGSLRGRMSCEVFTEIQKTPVISKEEKKLLDMGIKVDRVNEEIKSVVKETTGIKQDYTEIHQTVNQIKLAVSDGGGSNILKNSVGYKGLDFWYLDGRGNTNVTPIISTWVLEGVSKHGFAINDNSTFLQPVSLSPNVDYCLVFRLKKDIGGSFRYGIDRGMYYPDGEFVAGSHFTGPIYIEEPYTGVITMNFNSGNDPYDLAVVFYGHLCELTDIGLYEGHNITGWQQHSGETYTLNVLVDETGLIVYSSDKKSRTVMSPEEFAGYYGDTKVFTINGEITEVQGLKIKEKGLFIPPIKLVQSTERNCIVAVWTGW